MAVISFSQNNGYFKHGCKHSRIWVYSDNRIYSK